MHLNDRILAVDDHEDNLTILEELLAYDYTVMGVTSGEEALRVAPAFTPDLILLDVMMPGMDGMTTLQKLREQEHGRTTPVIFMTARVQKSEVDRLLALGVRGLIPKPFDPMTLPAEIRSILES